WLSLEKPQTPEAAIERPALSARGAWTSLLEPARRQVLARALMSYVAQRRWFRGKARSRKHIAITDVLRLEGDGRFAIALLHVDYDHGAPETYVVPIAFSEDAEPSETQRIPALVIASV